MKNSAVYGEFFKRKTRMRKKTGFLKTIGIFMFLLLIPALAFSEEAGRVSKASGRVDILRNGADKAVPVKENDPVSIGDIIRTKSDGRAEITFIDNSVMKIGPRSRLGIEEYLYKPDKSRNVSLKLYRGIAGFHVTKSLQQGEGSKFEMKTRTAVAGVRGTEGILYTNAREAVYLKEGLVRYSNSKGAVMVGAGMAGEVIDGKAPVERQMRLDEYKRFEEKLSTFAAQSGADQRLKNAGDDGERPGSRHEDDRVRDRAERHITGPDDRYEPNQQETLERPEPPKGSERLNDPRRDTHEDEIISQPSQTLPVTDVDGTSKVGVEVKFK
jgi:FecR-like protein